jgi:UDP-N-acetyl-D-glucosamine dehydrogenase
VNLRVREFKKKILAREIKIGVIGLGYVGLPLAIEFARAGFQVTGFDADRGRITSLKKHLSYIEDVESKEIEHFILQKKFFPSLPGKLMSKMDIINICVPTPLRKTREPDISYIIEAIKEIKRHLREGQLIILESTTYPGTTEEIVLPLLEETGLKVGKDFYLAFSPERIDPGNKKYTLANTPKIVGGITSQCTSLAKFFYSQVVKEVLTASSPKSAEMVKLLENTFRNVNIGLVNEIALMCQRLELNVWEVIKLAQTKPFGFLAFYPGPGLGGHCIPIDPIYLAWKARSYNFKPSFIELADEVNRKMPEVVVQRIAEALNLSRKSVGGAKIFILGVAYKKDVSDTRESPALEIIRELLKKKADVYFHDPYVREIEVESKKLTRSPLVAQKLRKVDCSVIVTDHTAYDYHWIVDNTPLIIDTRGITYYQNIKSKKIILL